MFTVRVTGLTILFTTFTTWAAVAQPGGSIGIYADRMGTSVGIVAPQYEMKTFYVLAKPDPASLPDGIAGAEFRIKGKPASGLLVWGNTNNYTTVVLPSPFSDESRSIGSRGGTNVAWPSCQQPDARGFVLLYTCCVIDLEGTTDVVFEVDAKDPPSNADLNCIILNGCDAPVFTAFCSEGGVAYLNKRIAVEGKSWSEVKRLYE